MVAKAGKNFTPAQNDPVQKSAVRRGCALLFSLAHRLDVATFRALFSEMVAVVQR